MESKVGVTEERVSVSEVVEKMRVEEATVRPVELSLSEVVTLDEGSILKTFNWRRWQLTHLKSEEKLEGENALEDRSDEDVDSEDSNEDEPESEEEAIDENCLGR